MTNLEEIRQYDKQRRRQNRLRANGLCTKCGRPAEGKWRCKRCTKRESEQARRRKYQQNSGNAPHDGAGRIEHLLKLSAIAERMKRKLA